MRMIAPRTGAPEITVAEDQEEYMPITVALYDHPDGVRTILARFTFSAEERAAIAAGADVYFGQLNFGGPMTPINACVGAGDWTVPPEEAA